MVPVARNPIDAVWTDRPPPPARPRRAASAGAMPAARPTRSARTSRKALREAKQDAAVLTDPASIAWLLNIRGGDVPFTPFALGFALVHADGGTELFMDPAKLPEPTRAWLGNAVSVAGREALAPALARLAGKTRAGRSGRLAGVVRADAARGGRHGGGRAGPVPAAEGLQERSRSSRAPATPMRAMRWRSAASCIGWPRRCRAASATEMSAAAKLLALRRRGATGSAARASRRSPAPASMARSSTTASPRTATGRSAPNEVYLIDSGAQYPDGTTDITRTVWTGPDAPPAELRDRVTRVMKGHIAIATAVFPAGRRRRASGRLRPARAVAAGLDYDHGTGHGVGSYLSVHEGPVSLSRLARPVPIAAGMILSNEPGFYLPDHYGIRLENLLLVQPAELPGASKPFLRFETLTLAPFDTRLIDPGMLDAEERAWLDAYHARVLAEVGPKLDAAAREVAGGSVQTAAVMGPAPG